MFLRSNYENLVRETGLLVTKNRGKTCYNRLQNNFRGLPIIVTSFLSF